MCRCCVIGRSREGRISSFRSVVRGAGASGWRKRLRWIMPARVADAIILRTYPLREADRIVSFFTRQFGKCRGVGRGARRATSAFGAALEPLTQVNVAFFEPTNRDLVSIDRCEVVASMLATHASDYAHSVILGYIAEIADRLLPEHEVNDAVFRLLVTVLKALRDGAPPWLPLLYDLYWMVRLEGFLPDLGRCLYCGRQLEPAEESAFQPGLAGLLCRACRPAGTARLSPESRAWAGVFAKTPLEKIAPPGWETSAQAADLRLFLHQRIEEHIEQRIMSWQLLQAL